MDAMTSETDDESTLHLNDGTACPASEIEAILKKHLPAVAYVVVLGSKRAVLCCVLTLKTEGSEALEAGKDVKKVAEPLKLAAPALELAQSVGSDAKDAKAARLCNKFRTLGLLPGFSKANREINIVVRQVRRFSVLVSNFSIATGQLNADGTLARRKIIQQWQTTINTMYGGTRRVPSLALAPAERKVADGAIRMLEDMQPLLDPTGKGIWEPRYDERSNRVYWINHELRQTSWTAPVGGSEDDSPAAAARDASKTLTVPEGWERKIDERTGRAYYLNHVDKTTTWDFPIDERAHRLASQQAECVVCFDPMHREPCGAFMKKKKRTCRHFLHYRCAMQLKNSGRGGQTLCPVCRTPWDGVKQIPDIDKTPDKWFQFADFDRNQKLSQSEIIDVLGAQFPIDHSRLTAELPSLWPKWDVSGTGFITLEDLKHNQLGLLNYIRREFLRKDVEPETLPDITEDKRVWFLFFSQHDNTMQEEEIVRALIKSYGTAQDKEWQERVREVVSAVWCVLVPGGASAVDLEAFLAPDGFGESIVAAVQNFGKEEEVSAAALSHAPDREASWDPEHFGLAPPSLAAGGREPSLPPPVLLAREMSSGFPLGLPRSSSGLSKEQVEEIVAEIQGIAGGAGAHDLQADVNQLLACMRNGQDVALIQVAAFRGLREMLSRDAEKLPVATKFSDSGGLEVMVKAMDFHERHWLVQQEGCGTLSSLLETVPAKAKNAIEDGAVPVVFAAVHNHPSNAMVAAKAFQAIAALAATHGDAEVVAEAEKNGEKGTHTILARMKANVFNVRLQVEGVRALHALSIASLATSHVKSAPESVKTVVLVMNDHWEPDLHSACCRLLQRWAYPLADELSADAAPKAVLEAAQMWVSEPDARQAALECLKAMAEQPKLKAALIAEQAEAKMTLMLEQLGDTLLPADPSYALFKDLMECLLLRFT